MNASERNIPELLLGFGIVALGLVIAAQAGFMKAGPAYAKIGPAAFPWVVGLGLIACGGLISWRAWRGPNEAQEEQPNLAGPAAIVAGLVLQIILLERAGFIITASVVFFLTALGFGSRRYARDAIAAVLLAGLAYVVFRYGLGLRLPVGSLFG